MIRRFQIVLIVLALSFTAGSAAAQGLSPLLQGLLAKERSTQLEAIVAIGQSRSPRALPILTALSKGRLLVAPSNLLVIDQAEGKYVAAESGAATTLSAEPRKVRLTNTLRRALSNALAYQQLNSTNVQVRLAAAQVLSAGPSDGLVPALRAALDRETEADVKALLSLGLATADLSSGDGARRLSAIATIEASGDVSFIPRLKALARKTAQGTYLEPNRGVRRAAESALSTLEFRKLVARVLRDLFYGASLGSVLLLAALGLAITFGLMGVINMAHGEMLMLGAYTTYGVQQLFVTYAPGAIDFYLLAALPAAFTVCMLIGVLIERVVIRHLYGRPLETLLATFGISLLLIQTVRVLFGASNVAVANPSYLSGGYELLPGFVLPYARLAILAFVVVVVGFVWYLLNKTGLGLQMRAITQNRGMAAAVGVRTARVDMLTFGLGSAVAGLGGVALSQIGNVGPELGQGYIVDCFMVVVVGGVGKLVGTVVTSLGLGVVNKVLEPISGAVLGKILVLAFVILFIQRRPQGLFSLKGRSVEG